MTVLKQILFDIATAIVDSPDEVTVVGEEVGDTVNLTLSVASDDMGMVIGRNGKIAKAIRTVMKAAATTRNKKVNVEIK